MVALGGTRASSRLLVLRVGSQLCGVPVAYVLETCRPLPVESLPNAPAFVAGVALLRGRATPVVDGRRLLGHASEGKAARFIALKFGADDSRVVALTVDAVIGVREVKAEQLESLPGVLSADQPLLQALGTLDSELLFLIEHARLLPDALWAELERARAS